ncbi:MAG TPA: acyl carrier protein [Polyangiaceae bacterium]|nr:acyl carrier protein [Polyangiaceae bacterium]
MTAPKMREVENDRPTRQALLAMFCETATEVVERDFHHVMESMRIDELVIDSLGMLEIIGSLERRLRIQVPDESLAGLRTIQDLLDVVEGRLA